MTGQNDNWDKPRSNGTHLSPEEIEFITRSFRDSRKIDDVARDLKCASRTVAKYYGYLRAQGTPQRQTRRKESPAPSPRFYRSNFEL